MFRGQGLAKPKRKSRFGAVAATLLIIIGSQTSPVIGYILALAAMIMMLVADSMGSIWPTQAKEENSLVFSVFWGLMIGLLVPFIVTLFLEGGAEAVVEMFTSEP